MDSANDRKQYRHVAAQLDQLKTYPKGQEEANSLAAYWYVYHKNRPAVKDELKKAGYQLFVLCQEKRYKSFKATFSYGKIIGHF